MKEIIGIIIGWIIACAVVFGIVCLGVLFFALAFGFEWSIWLCLATTFAIMVAKWIFNKDNDA